jgi:hypothetical protein
LLKSDCEQIVQLRGRITTLREGLQSDLKRCVPYPEDDEHDEISVNPNLYKIRGSSRFFYILSNKFRIHPTIISSPKLEINHIHQL